MGITIKSSEVPSKDKEWSVQAFIQGRYERGIATFTPRGAVVLRKTTSKYKKPFYESGHSGNVEVEVTQDTMFAWYKFTASLRKNYKVHGGQLELHRPAGLRPFKIPRDLLTRRFVVFNSLTAAVPGHIVKIRDVCDSPVGQIYRNKGCSERHADTQAIAALAMQYTPDMLRFLQNVVNDEFVAGVDAWLQRATAGLLLMTILDLSSIPNHDSNS